MTIIYDLIYLLAVSLGWPYLVYRRLTRGPSHTTLRELLGGVPSRPVAGSCIWIHGVSLGEINAARTIVAEIKARAPQTVVVISSTTRTGLDRARTLYADHIVFRFPLDFSFAIRNVLRRIRPSAIILMELEVWPNLIEVAAARGIPVMIANGRLTESKSMKRFGLPIVRGAARRMFSKLTFIGAQEQIYADRFVELGARRDCVEVTGSVKYDAAEIADHIEGQDALADEMGIDRHKPLWVAGSTGPNEESVLLDAYAELLDAFGDLQLAIVPRKPERFDSVASLIVERGFTCLRRSTGLATTAAGADPTRHVYLGDTMGELRKFYGLATVVFVGRSLTPMGGSDVMEAAGLAKPVLIGPHTDNFTEAVDLLIEAGGAERVRSSGELVERVAATLSQPDRRAKMGAAARQAVVSMQGATRRTVDQILDRLS